MQEQLISLKTAKLAKEKGFNLNSHGYYGCDNPSSGIAQANKLVLRDWEKWVNFGKEDSPQDGTMIYSAPTQAMLEKWLRTKYNIHMHVIHNEETDEYSSYLKNKVIYVHFKSHEEALEAALVEGLKLIK